MWHKRFLPRTCESEASNWRHRTNLLMLIGKGASCVRIKGEVWNLGVAVSHCITRFQTQPILSLRVRSATTVICGIIVALDSSEP